MPNIQVKIKLDKHGMMPLQGTADAAGMDLKAGLAIGEVCTIFPTESRLVSTGISMAIPKGWEGQIRPRSGLAFKTGITVLNTPGTIDADYRGDIGIILINHGAKPVEIERGDRIAQIVFSEVPKVSLVEVDNLDDTDRGAGGFGSTGISGC